MTELEPAAVQSHSSIAQEEKDVHLYMLKLQTSAFYSCGIFLRTHYHSKMKNSLYMQTNDG